MGHATRDCVLHGVNFNMRYVQSEGRPLADKKTHSYGRQTEIDAARRLKSNDIPHPRKNAMLSSEVKIFDFPKMTI